MFLLGYFLEKCGYFVLPENEIPNWLRFQSVGCSSSTTWEVPPPLPGCISNQNISVLGFAFSAIVAFWGPSWVLLWIRSQMQRLSAASCLGEMRCCANWICRVRSLSFEILFVRWWEFEWFSGTQLRYWDSGSSILFSGFCYFRTFGVLRGEGEKKIWVAFIARPRFNGRGTVPTPKRLKY